MKRTTSLQQKTPLRSFTGLSRSGAGLSRKSSLKRSTGSRLDSENPRIVLDAIFSEFIRRNSCLPNSSLAICVTCSKVLLWTDLDCGHYCGRDNTATRYLEENTGVQCKFCNQINAGENDKFAEYLDRKYGPGHAEKMKALARTTPHGYPYEEKIAEYRAKLSAIVEYQDKIIQY